MKPSSVIKWYSEREVEALIFHYAELKSVASVYGPGLRVLLLMADLDRAIRDMPRKEYFAVLLHGQLGYVLRDAEKVLGISRSTLHDRFQSGVTWLTSYLNGEDV
jgi:DNA-directed RNA polymerase specialized sigma24 family protein